MLFMDPAILQYGQIERARTTPPVPAYVLQFVGDINEVVTHASTYFETVHTWMPIVSKKRFYDHHLQPMFHHHGDFTLLLLSMKLITSMLPNELANPRTPAYNAAKHFYLEIEASGMMSIQVLQAGLLLSLYELGHAIYPSAYLSIGACARYAYALGINKDAKVHATKVLTLVELEENKRVLWGIVILDRFVLFISFSSQGQLLRGHRWLSVYIVI
jgi:Fungal specific transcription factor domain